LGLRFYLTGRISIEAGDWLIEERELAGRQMRLALAYLVSERDHPTTHERLASALWPDAPPAELETAISAILSKLRSVLKRAGCVDSASIEMRSGNVHLRLPSQTWIDIEEAGNAIDEAEGLLRGGNRQGAWGRANVAVSIGRRPFLPDEEAPWIAVRRRKLTTVLTRGLRVLSDISATNQEPALALQYATEMVELEPFDERGYQNLMRLQAQMGNRAEALRVYGRCRELIREELGADPSPETEALFLKILRSDSVQA